MMTREKALEKWIYILIREVISLWCLVDNCNYLMGRPNKINGVSAEAYFNKLFMRMNYECGCLSADKLRAAVASDGYDIFDEDEDEK